MTDVWSAVDRASEFQSREPGFEVDLAQSKFVHSALLQIIHTCDWMNTWLYAVPW